MLEKLRDLVSCKSKDEGPMSHIDLKGKIFVANYNSTDLKRILYRGDRGDDVAKIQQGINHYVMSASYIKEDGIFGANTEREVRNFQTDKKINATGVVGPATAGAMGIDFNVPVLGEDENFDASSYEKIFHHFRNFLHDEWDYVYSTKLAIPKAMEQVPGLERGYIYVNTILIRKFAAIFRDISKDPVALKSIKSYGGCFSKRFVRGANKWSLHSWGIAVDINHRTNPLGSSSTDIHPRVVDIFENYGFSWGASWKNRPDPMHFEYRGRKGN